MTELLTDAQVAKGLHIHVRTLRRRIKANRIALNYIPVGRKMLFRPAAVEDYLRSLEVIRTGSGRVNPATKKIRIPTNIPKTVFYSRDDEFVEMSDVKARIPTNIPKTAFYSRDDEFVVMSDAMARKFFRKLLRAA